jgi:hypothetical protein
LPRKYDRRNDLVMQPGDSAIARPLEVDHDTPPRPGAVRVHIQIAGYETYGEMWILPRNHEFAVSAMKSRICIPWHKIKFTTDKTSVLETQSFAVVYGGVGVVREKGPNGKPQEREIPVAVKIFHSQDPNLDQEFRSEIEAGLLAQHPALMGILNDPSSTKKNFSCRSLTGRF